MRERIQILEQQQKQGHKEQTLKEKQIEELMRERTQLENSRLRAEEELKDLMQTMRLQKREK